MNKKFRIIALCLCVAAFAVLFAGCDALDEMKRDQAIISSDKKTIEFRGNTYIKLPEDCSFYFSRKNSMEYDNNIVVTDEGVPVLLSDYYAYPAYYDTNSDLISVYEESVNIDEDSEFFFATYEYEVSEAYNYCNEEVYSKYINALENSAVDRIGFEYETTIYNTQEGDSWEIHLGVISETASKEIIDHIQNPKAFTKETYSEICDDYDYPNLLTLAFYRCDSEGLIGEFVDGYDILKSSDGDAYLVNYFSETALKLSSATAEEIEDKYLNGEYFEVNENGELNVLPPPSYY